MAERDDLCGRTVGELVLRDRIGQGGFGAVYRCEQPLLGRESNSGRSVRSMPGACGARGNSRNTRAMYLLDSAVSRGALLALAIATGSLLALGGEPESQVRIVVTETETEILDVISFAPGTSQLEARSLPTLDAVAATLRGNPSIELVEVQAHTSGIGDETANLTLTDQRAAAVVQYLVAAGVEPARLEAQGYGDTQPIDRTSPAKNERVAFLILKRS
jgi:outer membrane protein OmpA-like peptidoglycan-associated protein